MAALFSSGVSPDGILSGGLTLVSLFVSNVVTLGLALYQNRSNNRTQAATAEKWQAHAEELRDRMERFWKDRLTSQAAQYEASLQWFKDELARRRDRDER